MLLTGVDLGGQYTQVGRDQILNENTVSTKATQKHPINLMVIGRGGSRRIEWNRA